MERAEEIFLTFAEKNGMVTIVILLVLAVRFLLRNCPKKYAYWLWAIVGLRMVFDLPFSARFSIFNLFSYAGRPGVHAQLLQQPAGSGSGLHEALPAARELLDGAGHTQISSDALTGGASWSPGIFAILFFVWLAGMLVVLGYGICSWRSCRKRVRTAVIAKGIGQTDQTGRAGLRRIAVWQCEKIPSPFVMGIFRPKIYVPFGIEEHVLQYILAHESCHIRRLDPLWKQLAFLLLAVYWWNPLVWVAFACMAEDMEMSCDEAVIASLGCQVKKEYSVSLLTFAAERRPYSFAPVAFGEGDAKRRITNVLHFKKNRVWVTVILTCLLVAVAAVCLTNQVQASAGPQEQAYIGQWAEAFCQRDGDAILRMTSEDAKKDLEERDLLMGQGFGWSSPWPWTDDPNTPCYVIASIDPESRTAEILYYAKVSDPHVTVWKETIGYSYEDGNFQVTGEELKVYDAISSGADFAAAYPQGIDGTAMDYMTNNMKEALKTLNGYIAGSGDDPMLDPIRAAQVFLNLSTDESKVQLLIKEGNAGEAMVQIYFTEDDTVRQVKMIQPWGEDGIWVPQDAE